MLALVRDAQDSEPRLLSKAEELLAGALYRQFPVMRGGAFIAGQHTGTIRMDVTFYMKAGELAVEVVSSVEPPAIVATFQDKV